MSSASGTAAQRQSPTAHPTVRIKHVFVYAVMSAILMCISWSAGGVAWAKQAGTPLLASSGYAVMALFTGWSALLAFQQAQHCWKHRSAPVSCLQEADQALYHLGVVVPITLLLASLNPLPTSDDRKSNCLITFAFLLRLGALMDLPVKHTVVQFLLTYPLLIFLDFHRRCHHPSAFPDICIDHGALEQPGSPQSHCCSLSSFGHHVLSRGITMFLLGLVAVSVPVVMAIKQGKASSNDTADAQEGLQQHQHAAPNAECSSKDHPQSSVALNASSVLLPINVYVVAMEHFGPILDQVEAWLTAVADKVDEVLLVLLVCVPFALYYASFALVSRIMPRWASTANVGADEWLLALSVFFVLGRESCIVDMMPTLQRIQGQLGRAQVILSDILPSHVVDMLLDRKGRNADECQHNTSFPTPSTSMDQLSPLEDPRSRSSDGRQLFSAEGSAATLMGPGVFMPSNSSVATSISSMHELRLPHHTTGGSRKFKVAESHECVTIFFSEICDFAAWARHLPAAKVMQTLNDLYSRLDDIIINEFPGLYKVETIGHSYLVASNLIISDEQHAATMVRFALRAQEEASKVSTPGTEDGLSLQLRIGIHSGPTVSGFVGKVRRHFCLFGNTINMASRTETTCPPGCIQVTEAAYQLAEPHLRGELVFKDRGQVSVKGASKPLHMYLVVSRELLDLSRSWLAADLDLLSSVVPGVGQLQSLEHGVADVVDPDEGMEGPQRVSGSGSTCSELVEHCRQVQARVHLSARTDSAMEAIDGGMDSGTEGPA